MISNQRNSIIHIGNGIATAFPFDFKIFDKENLLITINNKKATRYQVAFFNESGTVTFEIPPEPNSKVIIMRTLEPIQKTNFLNQGGFYAKRHEDGFDYLTLLIQDSRNGIERALKYPIGGTDYDAQNRKIVSLAEPQNQNDAATKGYVEKSVAAEIEKIKEIEDAIQGRFIPVCTGNSDTPRLIVIY